MFLFQFYTYEGRKYSLYRLLSHFRQEQEFVTAFPLHVHGWKPHLLIPDFSSVGVFKYLSTGEERVTVRASSIKGKVVQVSNFLVTVPFNVLEETF